MNQHMNRTYYLNNSGTRVKIVGYKFASLELDPKTGNSRYHVVVRTVDYFEQVGQFACAVYRQAGKRKYVFFDDFHRHNGLPVALPNQETIRQYLSGLLPEYAGMSFSDQYKAQENWLASFGIIIPA